MSLVLACEAQIESELKVSLRDKTTTEEAQIDSATETEQIKSDFAKFANSECVDPDLNYVKSDIVLTLCDGTTATGKLNVINCNEEYRSNCFLQDNWKAISHLELESIVLVGNSFAGISGSNSLDLPDSGNVLSTDSVMGIQGELILPEPDNVVSGTNSFGNPKSPVIPTYTAAVPRPVLYDLQVSLDFNKSSAVTLPSQDQHGNSLTYEIIDEPASAHVSLENSSLIIKAIENDSFTYSGTSIAGTSPTKTVTINVKPKETSEVRYKETYKSGARQLSSWQIASSTFGWKNESTTFVNEVFDSNNEDLLKIEKETNFPSEQPDSFFQEKYGALPVDGTGTRMGSFPFYFEIAELPECYDDVEVIISFKKHFDAENMGMAMNYQITGEGAEQLLTGYQLFLNGIGTTTLSRFVEAGEYAFSFIDRWPGTTIGTEAGANPIEHGPYKGWDYLPNNTPYPSAGGLFGHQIDSNEAVLATKYSYDKENKEATIFWELRNSDGTDSVPGSWDFQRTLAGDDALPPGGEVWIFRH